METGGTSNFNANLHMVLDLAPGGCTQVRYRYAISQNRRDPRQSRCTCGPGRRWIKRVTIAEARRDWRLGVGASITVAYTVPPGNLVPSPQLISRGDKTTARQVGRAVKGAAMAKRDRKRRGERRVVMANKFRVESIPPQVRKGERQREREEKYRERIEGTEEEASERRGGTGRCPSCISTFESNARDGHAEHRRFIAVIPTIMTEP